jgi:catechol 2,3-dioxygenase-like lactoylglutathione lyase family enzyme
VPRLVRALDGGARAEGDAAREAETMKSAWNHLQFNIEPANRPLYKDLFTLLGWQQWHEDEKMLGMGVEGKGSFWFASAPGKRKTDYDQLGVNHIAVRAEEQRDVDAVARFLKGHGVPALFETPRHRSEFAEGEGQTYYQVMFTSPDNILFEVVYIGPKAG